MDSIPFIVDGKLSLKMRSEICINFAQKFMQKFALIYCHLKIASLICNKRRIERFVVIYINKVISVYILHTLRSYQTDMLRTLSFFLFSPFLAFFFCLFIRLVLLIDQNISCSFLVLTSHSKSIELFIYLNYLRYYRQVYLS